MISENIKNAREKVGISQRELGRRIGKTGQYISYLEKSNHSNPSLTVLKDIAKALEVPLSEIIENSETLTNKLIKIVDTLVLKDIDPENTLELICELIDINIDILDAAIHDNEDLSESYLVSLINIIANSSMDMFLNFYTANEELISNYPICLKRCNEIISVKNVEAAYVKNSELTNKVVSIAKTLKDNSESWHNAVVNIENKPKYLLNSILNYLENTEEYYSPFLVDILNKDNDLAYFTDKQINDIVEKITDLVKYEIYKIETDSNKKSTH